MSDELIADQIAYYRARAPEYDEWWNRSGRYDKGDEFARGWRAEVDEAVAWLDAEAPSGEVVELAAGTGNWSVQLARHAQRLTLVDASPETLEINRAKLAEVAPALRVEHVVADLFAWSSPRSFDVAFFSFWLSHVPDARLGDFFDIVDRALVPGGRALMVDNKGGPTDETGIVETTDGVELGDQGLSERELNDGRTFTIVKVYRSPALLATLLAPLGWDVQGGATENYFTWATITRR